jgi:orotidine-5'-phosphate decarboxylase
MLIITPGVRPADTAAEDQQRVVTPAMAIHNGADLIVVGRPIRDAADPIAVAQGIVSEIATALESRE